ncbi:MAG: ATP-binding cassette domain-containing protein [Spirochaetaceae bacterium]|jgi:energy-coupling factor transport system ATP-binding protein|nr:ATP-binding cassette domain-containing protein [Spirochaetaceae bacterium]
MSGTGIRIAVKNLSFTYNAAGERPSSSVRALSGVCFLVREGEFVSILGANGSGKSTLLSCINGLCTPPPGTVTVYDREGRAYDPADDGCLEAIRRITGTVLQNPDNQIVGSVVEEDCAFGPENLGLPPEIIADRVALALRQTGIEALRGRSTRFLSGGEKQRLAVAGALAMGGDILLLDECTAMIDPAGREQFYAFVAEFVRDGRTVIQITHSLEDAARSSRCLVFDKGVITYDGPSGTVPVTGKTAFTTITKTAATTMKPPSPQTESSPPNTQNPACISFDHVIHVYLSGTTHERTALNDVSLEIGRNESVAVMGATGCGKSTVLKHINALLLPTAGRVTVFGGDTLDRKTSLDTLRRRVCLALQSPETALFETRVADDVAYGARNGGLKGNALARRVREVMNAVGLPFDEFADRETFTLSGGEARLAALAGVFVRDSDIVLLDEPTAGLDDEHSGRILRLLEELKRRGKTIVVSTHSPQLAAFFDRVVMMVDGRPAGEPSVSHYAAPEASPAGGLRRPCLTGRLQGKPLHGRHKTGFEFFRGAMPGVFLGIDSPLERLSARIKLFAAVLCVIAAAVPGPVFPASLLAALLVLGRVWGKIRPIQIVRSLLPMMPVLTIFIALRLLFSWNGDTSRILVKAGPVSVTIQELTDTAMILLRLFTMMAVITLYSSVTSLRDTLGAVKKLCAAFASPRNGKAGGPGTRARDIGLTLGIALRFVPLITVEAEHIAASQISRGAKTRGLAVLSVFKAMLIPLFLRSLERAQTLAQAMLLRLYR